MANRKIAFFDFDGTITTADTMLELIKFHFGKYRFYLGMISLGYSLIGLKLKFISRQQAKEKLLTYFFGGMKATAFEEICKLFSDTKLKQLIRKEAIQKIENLKAEDTEIVVVTASASAWVKYWCEEMNLPFLSSELEIIDGRITGKLKGINCNEMEKVNRITKSYALEEFNIIECYGDSAGDKAMLAIATHPFYRRFD